MSPEFEAVRGAESTLLASMLWQGLLVPRFL